MTPHVHALLRHYAFHHRDRRLPWRRPREPLVRLAMVEAMPLTEIFRCYDAVFDGIATPEDWLELTEHRRATRLESLNLGKSKRKAIDSIAQAMLDGVTLWPVALERYLNLGSYTAGMIGLLYGAEAVPVNAEIERVGKRAANDGAPARWVRDLVRASRGCGYSHTGRAPAYEAVCAVLDVGATMCLPEAIACHRCPLNSLCASRHLIDTQAAMDLPDPPPSCVPRWGHLELRAVNVGMQDWVSLDLTVEAGWGEALDDSADHLPVDRAIRVALVQRFQHEATGEFDFRGTLPDAVAQQIADLLPGKDPWCRVVVAEGVGAITAWGFMD